jgi:phosphoribosylaminoimidazolecarboxamide formyltransferase/IMP cyclohydrolase
MVRPGQEGEDRQLTRIAITRALISVYDKSGLADLARGLHEAGVEIVSTGRTAAAIAGAGVPVVKVDDLTGFPECLDGRVKTLHPRVHAGLLADTRRPEHRAQLSELGVAPFELLVSNLYPFQATVSSGAGPEECVEQIDIGGPAMIRAAAKNHASVAVVTDPAGYGDVLEAARSGGFTLDQRRSLAARAYAHTAAYDAAVASWFAAEYAPDETARETGWPEVIGALWSRAGALRYGENPHQRAALYVREPAMPAKGGAQAGDAGAAAGAWQAAAAGPAGGAGEDAERMRADAPRTVVSPGGGGADGGVAAAEQLHGKPMSYNNYVDADAARRAAHDFPQPCVAIIKHSNPCGIAIGTDLADAHAKANACDPQSAYGGVIAANGTVTAAMASQITEGFAEVVIAPGFEPEALAILTGKWKNTRLLRCPPPGRGPGTEWRPVSGGMLVQSADRVDALGDEPANWQLKAGPAADPGTLADLAFAWRACRAVKSNAILLASGGASVGIGMGQVSRVDSSRIAVMRAGGRAAGAVAASDAFFPFPDALEVLIEAGVRAVAEPGGSVRDEDSIEAAEKAGVTLYFTGVRHFFH